MMGKAFGTSNLYFECTRLIARKEFIGTGNQHWIQFGITFYEINYIFLEYNRDGRMKKQA